MRAVEKGLTPLSKAMRSVVALVALSTVAVCSIVYLSPEPELVHAQVLFRHGDRAPMYTFPNDIHQEDAWPAGWGEMTTIGMDQLYQQGLRLKQRYIDELKLVNSTYHHKEVYIRSSDRGRTLQSASSLLAAFYRDSVGTLPNWNPDWPTTFNPVPVHTVPENEDHLLNMDRSCPRKVFLDRERMSNPNVKEYFAKQQDLYDYLTNMTGTKFSKYSNLQYFFDTIQVERRHNLTIAPWITQQLLDRIEEVLNKVADYYYGLPGFGWPENSEMVKINVGYLLYDIVNKMLKTTKDIPQPKFYGYSTHDTQILSFMRTLGAKSTVTQNKRLIDMGAMLSLELWKQEESYFVKMLFSANNTQPFEDFTKAIVGCPLRGLCPLETFVNLRQKYMLKDPVKECARVNTR
ncbi:hypothetical protein L596_015919 [Steinernema carpocapsae]|uniref:Acid phosphatase n=1 Tax=Steinernema carpocapsae TaxID=34508 RepID=A0A4U5NHM2_STECR|nr:hypothetical protein L596_015919 [Steinernema carpocapsae]